MAITPTAVDTSLTKRKSAAGGGAQMPLQMNLSGRMSPMDAMASTPSQFRCRHPLGIPKVLVAPWLHSGLTGLALAPISGHGSIPGMLSRSKLLACPSRGGAASFPLCLLVGVLEKHVELFTFSTGSDLQPVHAESRRTASECC